METNKNTYSRIVDTVEPITAVEFRIYGNNDVIKYSAISDPNGITVAEIQNNNEPVQGGVIDRRLGVTESKSECGTCGETALKCPGHFGHIKLWNRFFILVFYHL